MKHRVFHKLLVKISIEMEPIKIVKVKAHKRLRNGNVENVRSHYRRIYAK